MAADEELRLDATVSPTLLNSLDKIQEIYAKWFPDLSPVTVAAPMRWSYNFQELKVVSGQEVVQRARWRLR